MELSFLSVDSWIVLSTRPGFGACGGGYVEEPENESGAEVTVHDVADRELTRIDRKEERVPARNLVRTCCWWSKTN